MTMPLIDLKQASKTSKVGETTVAALKNITLSIEAQTFVSFVGPSGSGKTTLLNLTRIPR